MRRTWTSRWKPGQPAPSFKAYLQDGTVISSEQLKGKKYILFFYNHDDSETCTKEACNVRDHYEMLTSRGYTVLGVSEDSAKKHRKFIDKYQFPFSLVADEGNQLARVFDIYGEKEFMGRISDAVHRTTFAINENGLIEAVIHPVDSRNHVKQILESLNESSST